jgi:hypothetical protein
VGFGGFEGNVHGAGDFGEGVTELLVVLEDEAAFGG